MDWFKKMLDFLHDDEVGNGEATVGRARETLLIASEHMQEIINMDKPNSLLRAMDAIQVATNVISTDIIDKRGQELSLNFDDCISADFKL